MSDLIFDAQGNLYGTTKNGGAFGDGTVFELTLGSNGKWSETVLHSFNNDGKDGFFPQSRLVFDKAGSLFGTTPTGGTFRKGTVFELTRGPSGAWSETVLSVGGMPEGDLIFDAASNIYGTTSTEIQGSGTAGLGGSVFKLSPASSGGWTETTLYLFNLLNAAGPAGRGSNPCSGVIFDAAGNLYGETPQGGTSNTWAVFRLAPGHSGTWSETVLYSVLDMSSSHLSSLHVPCSDLTIDSAGNLYGTTFAGGAGGGGTVFKLAPGASGAWSEMVLHNFMGGEDGWSPVGHLIVDAAGNVYGTTTSGGGGTVFRLAPGTDGAWTETVLHNFACNGTDGCVPYAGLIRDSAGNLYGTTSTGSVSSAAGGTVFEILAGSDPAASSNAPSDPASSSSTTPAPTPAAAAQGTESLASVWQSDAYAGQASHFNFDGSAIYVY